jgi:hypothetical protein
MALNTNIVEFWPLTTNKLAGEIGGNTLTQGGGLTWDSTNNCFTVTSITNPYLLLSGITLAEPFTLACEVYGNGGASGDYTYMGYMVGSGNFWSVHQESSTNLLKARSRAGGTAGTASAGATPSGGVWNKTGGVFGSNSSRQTYLAGALGTAETTTVNPSGSYKSLSLGSLYNPDDGAVNPISTTGFRFRNFAVWSRTLTQAELDSYFTDPSQVMGGGGGGVKSGLNFFRRKNNVNL